MDHDHTLDLDDDGQFDADVELLADEHDNREWDKAIQRQLDEQHIGEPFADVFEGYKPDEQAQEEEHDTEQQRQYDEETNDFKAQQRYQ